LSLAIQIGTMMSEKIAVILKRRDRIEEILPYIVNIARPGMRVLLLVPYPVDSWCYLRDHWVNTDSTAAAKSAGREISCRYAWHIQTEMAERKLAPAAEALRRLQIDVGVRLYTGSLSRAAKACKENGEAHLIMVSLAGDTLWKRLAGKIPGVGLMGRRRFSPVMLLHC
jgi:hypothetical protein